MSERARRFVAAVTAGAAILVVAEWVDAAAMTELEHRAVASFDPRNATVGFAAGYLAIAGGTLAVGLIGWWARSILVGIAYSVAGAAFTFLGVVNWAFAASDNGAPPVLPDPLVGVISSVYTWQQGPLSAVAIIAAAMLLTGVVTLVASAWPLAAASARPHIQPTLGTGTEPGRL